MKNHINTIIGWDIGGAHLKAAWLENGVLKQVIQAPCALWKGLDELQAATQLILAGFPNNTHTQHAITMTGELVDLFDNREAGVMQIADTMQVLLNGDCRYYQCDLTHNCFVSYSELQQCWPSVASANWHASAQLMANNMASGLLIDIGSTTSDLVVFHAGKVINQGTTDALRMRYGELVYTGVVRTPLMAVTSTVLWQGFSQPVIAEHFATTADIYRLTQQLPASVDMATTADNQDKSTLATARRLARIVGHDVEDASMDNWVQLAHAFKQKQLETIYQSADKQLKRLLAERSGLTEVNVVAAGVGAFLVKEVVALLLQSGHYPNINLLDSADAFNLQDNANKETSFDEVHMWGSNCLPAVAVALLASRHE